MRVVEFLILLLQAQAQTLQRLAALLGEETLLELLEVAGEIPNASTFQIDLAWFEPVPAHRRRSNDASHYAELEGSVRELNLPAVLEFHLWAYPFYRLIIESSIDLNLIIRKDPSDAMEVLVNEAMIQAKQWVQKLPIRPELGLAAERAAAVPWLRFRTDVLKRTGRRPIFSI